MNDIKTAAQALVDKLDIAMPKIDDAIKIATIHGHAYDGPLLSHELKALKAALERDKAIDELVKHDQEIGLYDEWGDPFYGSFEIAKSLNYYLPSGWAIRGLWINYGSFNGCAENLIYRLAANHHFYQTDLFKNAIKPDADHACRGGE